MLLRVFCRGRERDRSVSRERGRGRDKDKGHRRDASPHTNDNDEDDDKEDEDNKYSKNVSTRLLRVRVLGRYCPGSVSAFFCRAECDAGEGGGGALQRPRVSVLQPSP